MSPCLCYKVHATEVGFDDLAISMIIYLKVLIMLFGYSKTYYS